jgi:hypothetical protein
MGESIEAPFSRTVLVVDWSEIHSYICGSGPPRTDSLFELSPDKERVHGAHQAALSFLFEAFPNQLLVLPPHVRELMWFIEAAQQFADLRRVDEQLLRELYEKLDGDVVQQVKQAHADWQELHPGRSPRDIELSQIFRKLDEGASDTIRRCLTQNFAPMFLLGRWLTIDAVRDLQRLLDRGENRRVLFLNDYDQDLSRALSSRTQDLERWRVELSPRASKDKSLAANDARALAYLQALNCDQHARRGKQLLFVTRSEDLLGAVRNRPEWFSCLADRYSTAEVLDRPVDGSAPVTIIRNWIYFFELGAAWRPGQNLQADIARRLDAVRAMLASLPRDEHLSQATFSQSARQTLERYFETEAGLLNNIQTLSSAQNAQFTGRGSHGSTDRPLIDFLRFVTDPAEFIKQRSELQDEMKDLVERINAVLPPVPSAPKNSRYRPILRSILEVLPAETFVEDISKSKLKNLTTRLLRLIRENRHSIPPSSQIGKELEELNEPALMRDPVVALVQSLYAYIYQAYDKALALVLQRRGLPGAAQLLRLLLIADYWLLQHERLHKVDEQFAAMLKLDCTNRGTQIQLALVNARVELDLEASYEHNEDPASFRRSLKGGQGCLREYWEELQRCFDSMEADEEVARGLYWAACLNLVHASARLTATTHDYDVDDTGQEAQPAADGTPLICAEKYVRQLELYIAQQEEPNAQDTVELVAVHDALGYYYFKKACMTQTAMGFGSASKLDPFFSVAESHLRAATELVERDRSNFDGSSQRALVTAHLELLERLSN